MSIIGEVYEQSSEINGAIVNVRNKGTKIAIWTNNATKENGDNIIAIGYDIIMFRKKQFSIILLKFSLPLDKRLTWNQFLMHVPMCSNNNFTNLKPN